MLSFTGNWGGPGNALINIAVNGGTMSSGNSYSMGIAGSQTIAISGGGLVYANDYSFSYNSKSGLGSSRFNISGGTFATFADVDVNSGTCSALTVAGGSLLLTGGNFNVAGGTLNASFVNGGTIQSSGGNSLYAYNNGVINLNVPAAGGTFLGTMHLNLGGTNNVTFTGGGTLTANAIGNYGSNSAYTFSGPGVLLTNTANGFSLSSRTTALSVTGGAAVYVGATSVFNGTLLNATLNGGTLSTGGISLNQNSTTSGGTLTANLSNGAVFKSTSYGDSGNGASQTNITVGSGCLFADAAKFQRQAQANTLNANISSGGTVQIGALDNAGTDTISGAGLLVITTNGYNHTGPLNLNGGTLQYGSSTGNATNTIGSFKGAINLPPRP